MHDRINFAPPFACAGAHPWRSKTLVWYRVVLTVGCHSFSPGWPAMVKERPLPFVVRRERTLPPIPASINTVCGISWFGGSCPVSRLGPRAALQLFPVCRSVCRFSGFSDIPRRVQYGPFRAGLIGMECRFSLPTTTTSPFTWNSFFFSR